MKARIVGVLAGCFVVGAASSAAAQVESSYPDEGSQPAQPAAPAQPAEPAQPALPAQPAQPAQPGAAPTAPVQPTTTPAPAAPDTAEQPKTITYVLPDHRFEVAGRLGVIGGGELTPKGLLVGHVQPSWVGAFDFDVLTLPFNPFFTFGVYTQFTNAGYDRFDGGKQTNTAGDVTLISLGPSVKARIPLGDRVALKAGVYLGYNHMSFSVTESGKDISATGSGMNIGFTGELAVQVSRVVAISAQASFISQVAGSVTVDGDSQDHDLAMTPKPFLTIGPQFQF